MKNYSIITIKCYRLENDDERTVNAKNKKNWFERVKRAAHTTHNQNNTLLRKGFAVIKTEWSATCAFAFGQTNI